MSKKCKRGTRRSPLPWIAAIAVLGIAMWILLANVVFVVRDVTVIGAGEVPEADARHLSGIQLGTRMTAIREERVRLDVESDGRLAFVGLKKRLPSRVELTVRPRSMDAVILVAGKILVLDSDAYVVRIGDSLPENSVPYVTGIKDAYYTLGRQLDTADGRCPAMKAVVEALKSQNATAYVSELNVSNTADLRITTRTGMTVLLGDAEDMPAKIAWMAAALADLEARGQTTGQLDVSSGTKADYRPLETDQSPEPEPEETPEPETQQTEVYSEADPGRWEWAGAPES